MPKKNEIIGKRLNHFQEIKWTNPLTLSDNANEPVNSKIIFQKNKSPQHEQIKQTKKCQLESSPDLRTKVADFFEYSLKHVDQCLVYKANPLNQVNKTQHAKLSDLNKDLDLREFVKIESEIKNKTRNQKCETVKLETKSIQPPNMKKEPGEDYQGVIEKPTRTVPTQIKIRESKMGRKKWDMLNNNGN